MNKATKFLLTGAGAAVAGMAALGSAAYASTNYLVRVAMDREKPKTPRFEEMSKRLRGNGRSGAYLEKAKCAAKQLESLPHETVHIQSRDGVTLVGHWFAHKKPKRIIVAMHGWRSSWSGDFGAIADFWQRNGCSVLYAEQRAHGSSGGAYMSFGLQERFDCLAWVYWANAQNLSRLPIYLAGVSMGATTVLMAAGLSLPNTVRGILADCGFTSPHDIWKHVAEKNLHMRYGLHRAIADSACRKRIQLDSRAYSTLDAMKQCKVPVLFVHGTKDRFVPVEMTYENYAACSASKRLLIVPEADHGMSYFLQPESYESAMTAFWKEFDDLSTKKDKK